jgi:hypothetical protein
MPNKPMDSLNDKSTDPQTQEAISSEIEACMSVPTEPGISDIDKRKMCAGKAYGMMRERTGRKE